MICRQCGMGLNPGEYHPSAACLMFKACRDTAVVSLYLNEVRQHERERIASTTTSAAQEDS